MIREEGRVVALDGDLAIITNQRKNACGGCSAEESCGSLSLGGGRKEYRLLAWNKAGAEVGDRVVLEIPERHLLRVSFLVYGVPVIALFVVGMLCRSLLLDWGVGAEAAEGWGAVAGLAALGLAMYLLRHLAASSPTDRNNLPVVSSVVGSFPIAVCAVDLPHQRGGCA